MNDELSEYEAQSDSCASEPNWLMRLWLSFWAWLTEPMPFPRDHWDRREVMIIWDEFDCDGDPALPESRAGEPVDSRSPPS
jgi:hypothetical protein